MKSKYYTFQTTVLVLLLLTEGGVAALDSGETSTAVYSADVPVVVDISVTINDADFGVIAPGQSSTITSSITFTNNGNTAEDVEAQFLSNIGPTEYGLIDGTSTLVITGDNFGLAGVSLLNDGTSVVVVDSATLLPSSTVDADAELNVPNFQEPATYYGTVELII